MMVEADRAKWYCVAEPNIWTSRLLVKAGFDLETHYKTVEAAVDAARKNA